MTRVSKQMPSSVVLSEEVDVVVSVLSSRLIVRGESGEMDNEAMADLRNAVRDALYVAACVRSAVETAITRERRDEREEDDEVAYDPTSVLDKPLTSEERKEYGRREPPAYNTPDTPLSVSFYITGLHYDWWLAFIDRFEINYQGRDSHSHFAWNGNGVSITTLHDFDHCKNRLDALETSIGITGPTKTVDAMMDAFAVMDGVEHRKTVWDRSII